ncbi:undecaprenyldiphospho-muramoylpentapeptide beta-N-acetylglucosaminyltransferase [Compostibacter hankyongensis]|uniref:UDP-N-acetylglucosamine--N-acetylmuramyl-(pentapeptide) pyrophosphoryl-undecaprenol N-acetylglucosamine transferase n=1 Tax=Compostibacter hankyongensis TaxID=1007089 RepID=A0ABP8FGM1_9BACT
MQQASSAKRIIMTGGGTGGHIFPAIAIARALQRLYAQTDILFVGALGKMEMEKIPQAGYPIEGLKIAGMNRGSLLKNLLLPFKLMDSIQQAGRILKRYQPHAVVGVGGYASFPVLYKAQRRGIPTVIQEQNSEAGKSNKILGKKARSICVAYEDMQKFFPADRIIYTGNPVRENISRATVTREEALRHWGLTPGKKTVFAVGGSQGARSINLALEQGLIHFIQQDVQLIWQTGAPFIERAREIVKPYEQQVRVMEFVEHMEHAYAAADVVISRAGALTISELCVAGKPVVFVPYPYAAEDHQTRNAMALVRKQAALMVADQAAGEQLVHTALELIRHDNKRQQLIDNITPLGISNADERIAREIFRLL